LEVTEPVQVLVMVDEPRMAGLLQRGLAEEGYDVDVATSGSDRLDAAVRRGPREPGR
jgi:two-component system OmpR family response regulator